MPYGISAGAGPSRRSKRSPIGPSTEVPAVCPASTESRRACALQIAQTRTQCRLSTRMQSNQRQMTDTSPRFHGCEEYDKRGAELAPRGRHDKKIRLLRPIPYRRDTPPRYNGCVSSQGSADLRPSPPGAVALWLLDCRARPQTRVSGACRKRRTIGCRLYLELAFECFNQAAEAELNAAEALKHMGHRYAGIFPVTGTWAPASSAHR
jgi:hypothetical protein